MAFSLANSSGVPGMNAQIESGKELPEISVESISFGSLAGQTKIKLVPEPWPKNNLPSSTSSLLSINSRRGLIAAAGPNALVVASTKQVREAFEDRGVKAVKFVKPFNASQTKTIEVPRLSHVAFTSDGAFLIICGESTGGLAVYNTNSFQGSNDTPQPALMMSTEDVPVRQLVPNPEIASMVAVVLGSGHLMIAELDTGKFKTGGNGSTVLKEGVSSVSWSVKGKQLIAGLGDGNTFQLDVTGAPKALIRQPPEVPADHHVSSLVWLANDEFLLVHTPNHPENPEFPPESKVTYVLTDKNRSQFQYRPVQDPSPAFGMNRVPPTHYISRLRKWHHISDMIIFSSVVSTDVGMMTRSDIPLTKATELSEEEITNVYTLTSFADDTKRATLPMSIIDDGDDTTAIGMALDLSAEEKVYQPIPGDEIDYSSHPLPAMMLLNHEGILAAWWIVVNDTIREEIAYPGLVTVEAGGVSSQGPTAVNTSAPQVSSPPPQTSGFGFGKPAESSFGKPAQPAFGQPPAPAFGQPAAPAFGASPALGQKASAWGTGNTTQAAGPVFGQPGAIAQPSPTFGKPTFGQPAQPSPLSNRGGFGAVGAIGARKSAWATTSPTAASPLSATSGGPSGFSKFAATNNAPSAFANLNGGQSVFGQPATSAASPFGQPPPKTSTFGASPASPLGGSSFGMSTQPSFASTVTIDSSTGSGGGETSKSLFGNASQTPSLFGQPSFASAKSKESDMMGDSGEAPKEQPKTGGLLGMGSDFKLGSTFKPATSGKEVDDEDEDGENDKGQKTQTSKPLFGSDFGAAVSSLGLGGKEDASKAKEGTRPTPSIFGTPDKKEGTSSIFGHSSKPNPFAKAAVSTFGQPSPQPIDSEPPEVVSKPQQSPSPATGPSTDPSNTSLPSGSDVEDSFDERSEDDEGSELSAQRSVSGAGSPAEAVEMPESDNEATSEVEEVVDDAPLPPDPTTVKTRPSWFKEAPPGAVSSTPPHSQSAPLKPLPKVASWTPAEDSPLFPSKTTTTPVGFPKAPVSFQQPMPSLRESPRSPSPIRSASTPVGKPPSQPAFTQPSRTASKAPSQPSTEIKIKEEPQSPPPLLSQPSTSTQPEQSPEPEPEPSFTASDLSDDEDERIRLELEGDPEPTLHLAEFVAHQDYVSTVTSKGKKDGLPHQIETLYRDINSMVDTLGLNARSLSAFIAGNGEFAPEERTKEDLETSGEDGDEWCIVEIEALECVEDGLEKELDEATVVDPYKSVLRLKGMRKDLLKTRQKLMDVRVFLDASKDAETRARVKNAPLDSMNSARQRELRSKYSEFQTQLLKAEEAVVVLRAKLASLGAASGKGAANGYSGSGSVPTVEAVENTIRKMTAMAEEKSGNVDFLERQMRGLGLVADSRPSSSSRSGALGMRDSMRSSGMFSSPSRRNGHGGGRTFELPTGEGESDSEADGVLVRLNGSVNGGSVAGRVSEVVELRRRRRGVIGVVRGIVRGRVGREVRVV
ncbi:hypothetical protein EJ08DRAFT_679808 [Tothia fuscella]|uniref:Nucleoporin Nup159/Nup146 N-terminal domain-containing protein n=1 Tax=Tothia fuscella TaxID=1048955 RepID=A0A9P4NQ62_9PEZI|nr:hypothetical protein EJ08DRAFT_679808 [Tothia fuscella]